MKKLIAAIILAAIAAAPLANAQIPRIRTSAPREKTAQLKGKTPETTDNHSELLPIPLKEIQSNPLLEGKNNPGY